MKKIFFIAFFLMIVKLVSGQTSTTVAGMYSIYDTACIKYDATSGKTIIKLTHGDIGAYTSGPFYYYYNDPYKTWAYVKNPSAPGFWGPFPCSGIYDPLVSGMGGLPVNYYEVSIPGFSQQICYEVYFVSNRVWHYDDPFDSWGYVPPAGLDPTVYNSWNSPVGVREIKSTGYPMTACTCIDSDPVPPCNSHFRLELGVNTRLTAPGGPSGGGIGYINTGEVKLHDFHPLSTYVYEWDGVVSGSSTSSLAIFGPTLGMSPGSHTVCVTEYTPTGEVCKTCLDYCIALGYNDTTSGGGSGSMMKKPTSLGLLEPINVDGEILIYPNPSTNKAEILIPHKQNVEVYVTVTDLNGKTILSIPKQILEQSIQKVILNTQNLSSGIYNVSITVSGKTEVKKLSVVR